MDDYEQRFGGIGRLYGAASLQRFRAARVCIVGLGGVGSWVAEALARSGIGGLTLIDLDDVCLTNINRQLPALNGTIGLPKVRVMGDRIKAINPHCDVTEIPEFLGEGNVDRLLAPRFDYVIDCVDRFSIKVLIILKCKLLGLPIVTVGGAGGRRDPTRIKLADLNRTSGDRLLKQVRKRLRSSHRFPAADKKKHGVLAVFSDEPQQFPWADGTCRPMAEPGANLKMDCASGHGAATHVTAAFGLVAAGAVLDRLVTATA